MLVLTQRAGDAVYIGDDIEVRILSEFKPGVFRVGYTAPKDVVILREKVKARNEEGSKGEK